MNSNLDDEYVERLMTSWSKTFRKMQSEIMQHRDLGLTGPQFHMLALIARTDSCNVSYLADALEVKPSAITVMVDRLVQNGYVQRRHDEQDRRSVLLSVTEEGAEVFEEAGKKSREVLKSYLQELSSHQLDVLLQVTEKLANMGQSHEAPA
ncbi:MarR family winged helix-turn-helix transcriptional regulator [Paenibacillus aceti]|uniref:MarR family transcriptional regulator n=1 Tax=Paenibacillus aceti TaxID=1820010 RepID=A0ABQ1VR12_9BACL|nr:MarR family transcriptional regulator [Paenibacillus aceti]GGF89625.1 MarR family transcriptional regulator [Paenibacillus aceti]